ncbi:hypothetical protein [Streptacidiphilus anmyonensis]|uniref:hypothetical protein n=1 Tax=Streptacidiphilus anmyonensis TaxID=405782 RepID=UPI000A4E7DC5|nr:hypothetical protein [Streptacidiphilus anmyonensis]
MARYRRATRRAARPAPAPPPSGRALRTTAVVGAGFLLVGLPLVAVVSDALGPFTAAAPPVRPAASATSAAAPGFVLPPVDGGGVPGALGYMYAAPSPAAAPQTPAGAVPALALAAYERAAQALASSLPRCHLTWPLLAGVGKVESDHAAGGELQPDGTAVAPILGPVLDGSGRNAAVHDTDKGVLDGDPVWDRAVGPMQILPSTWRQWAATDRPGVAPSPQNLFDAAVTAGRILCAAGGDLNTPGGIERAVYAYNHTTGYVQAVLAWTSLYATESLTAQQGVPSAASPWSATAPAPAQPGAPVMPPAGAGADASGRAAPPPAQPSPGTRTAPAASSPATIPPASPGTPPAAGRPSSLPPPPSRTPAPARTTPPACACPPSTTPPPPTTAPSATAPPTGGGAASPTPCATPPAQPRPPPRSPPALSPRALLRAYPGRVTGGVRRWPRSRPPRRA